MKITILSDSPFIPTGYSNQAKLFADYMVRKGHEIHFLANAYQGMTIKNATLKDGTAFNYTIYGQGYKPYFEDVISPHLKEHKSDIFWILLDTFMLHGGNGWFLNVDTSPARSIFWYPSDGGGGMPVDCNRILNKVECPVSMAQYGQKQVKDYYNIEAKHIPHGTEPSRFYKLPDAERIALKTKWNFLDKFVIGVVARNQPRKFLDRTMKAMNLIKNKIPNAVLFLHLDPNDPAQVFNIRGLINRYNLENRVVFSGMTAMKGFDWNKMNEIYNLMDCFFLSTSGEGFGIPIIEAMACEVPVVATDYTTTPELVIHNKAGFGINLAGVENVDMFKTNLKDYDTLVANGTLTGSWEVERAFCDINDAANKIETLYKNPELCKEMGKNGRKAVLEKYDFENVVGPAWEKLMLDMLK